MDSGFILFRFLPGTFLPEMSYKAISLAWAQYIGWNTGRGVSKSYTDMNPPQSDDEYAIGTGGPANLEALMRILNENGVDMDSIRPVIWKSGL